MSHQRAETLSETYAELASALVANFDVDEFLDLLCHRTHQVLAVHAAGVMLESRSGQLRLWSASTDDVAAIELFELQAEEGPCFDAYTSGEQVVETDLPAAEQRWPRFVPIALEAGFRAVYGFPLRVHDERIGAMNLFRTDTGRFSRADESAAQALADIATLGLLAERGLEAETRVDQLQHALDSRVLIEQAKGVVATRAGIGTDEAFDRIRRHARARRTTIRSLCPQIIDGSLRLD